MTAIVGICTLDVQIPDSQSLKRKRQVIRSLKAQVRNAFNVSIAEVGHLDSWQLSTIAFCYVSTDAGHVHGLLEKVVRFVEGKRLDLVLLDYDTELV